MSMRSVKETIALTFAYYQPGQILDSSVLELYAKDLADLAADDVVWAYQSYRRDPKNSRFPLPAKIREIICPQNYISHEAQAAEIAARIVGSVSKFGWSNAKDAEQFIGPAGWSVVQRQGGWSYICENLGTRINPSTFQAQIRKQLEGSLTYGEDTIAKAIGAKPSERGGGLMQIGAVVKKLTDKRDPEDSA